MRIVSETIENFVRSGQKGVQFNKKLKRVSFRVDVVGLVEPATSSSSTSRRGRR